MPSRETFKPAKFREMVLYTAVTQRTNSSMNTVKMERLLYFMDMAAAVQLGRTISGARYLRYPDGPVPEPLQETLEELVTEKKLLPPKDEHHITKPREIYYPEAAADLGVFSEQEFGIILQVIEQYSSWTPAMLTAESVKEPGWISTPHRQPIPMVRESARPGPLNAREHRESWAEC